MGLAWKGMVHVLMWLGDVKQLESGSKESGNTEAVRARTVRSVAGLCCCLHSPTSAVLKAVAGVALQLSLVPVALSITVVSMSNYCILKSISVTVFERACALQAPSVLFAAEGTGLCLAPCWCHA